MVELKEKGIEVIKGITLPWSWADGIICGIIEKGNAEALTDPAVEMLDKKLQAVVDNTSFQFDNIGKAKLEKAFTMSMVKKFMPELLPDS